MKNMLSTARAIVLDDRYDEVEAAIKALARLGIGSVYLSGQIEDMPETPLHGIRLAIVDMDLTGAHGTDEEVARHTLAVLGQVLTADSNPLMVIVWTGSDGVFGEFARLLPELLPTATPTSLTRLSKSDFVNDVEGAVAAFRERIIEELGKARPLDVIWAWEQSVHDAASRTTSRIAELVHPPGLAGEDWSTAASNILGALGHAAAGSHHENPRHLLGDLLGAFEPMLQDRLEHHRLDEYDALKTSAEMLCKSISAQADNAKLIKEAVDGLRNYNLAKNAVASIEWPPGDIHAPPPNGGEPQPFKPKPWVTDLLKKPAKAPDPLVTQEQAARLNGMLQWAELPLGTVDVRPGNIFLIGDPGGAVHEALAGLGLAIDEMRRDTLGSSGAKGTAVIVESTPACDYAQNKWTMPKFVGGFLAPADARVLGATFLRRYSACWYALPGQAAAPLCLVLNSHFSFSLGMEKVATWSPILRLRRPTLADLQVWLSAQHMRQGLLSVSA